MIHPIIQFETYKITLQSTQYRLEYMDNQNSSFVDMSIGC